MSPQAIKDYENATPMLRFQFLQPVFWVFLAVISFFSLTLWYGQGTFELDQVIHVFVKSVLGYLISTPLASFLRSIYKHPVAKRVVLGLVAIIVTSAIWSAANVQTFIWLTTATNDIWSDFGGWYFSGFFIFLSWSTMFLAVYYYRLAVEEKDRRIISAEKARQDKMRRMIAEKSAVESRMQMLRYQLTPHFLFNTLNGINALIASNRNHDARKTVERLSDFLRYALNSDQSDWVSVAKEMDALKLYLEIEKIRFDDRLVVEFDISSEAMMVMVPSLLIQPLIENSIKYAVNAQEQTTTIKVKAEILNDQLNISVQDDGPGIVSMDDGEYANENLKFSGVGLKNVNQRLTSFFGDQYHMTLINQKGSGVTIVLSFPAEYNGYSRGDV